MQRLPAERFPLDPHAGPALGKGRTDELACRRAWCRWPWRAAEPTGRGHVPRTAVEVQLGHDVEFRSVSLELLAPVPQPRPELWGSYREKKKVSPMRNHGNLRLRFASSLIAVKEAESGVLVPRKWRRVCLRGMRGTYFQGGR